MATSRSSRVKFNFDEKLSQTVSTTQKLAFIAILFRYFIKFLNHNQS